MRGQPRSPESQLRDGVKSLSSHALLAWGFDYYEIDIKVSLKEKTLSAVQWGRSTVPPLFPMSSIHFHHGNVER